MGRPLGLLPLAAGVPIRIFGKEIWEGIASAGRSADNMCVGCRGFKVRMTEDLLNRTHLDSSLQAMRSVAVTKRMRRTRAINSGNPLG